VLAVASGDDGVALARRLGADASVDGRREDVVAAASAFAPEGLDAALVTAGGATAEQALRAVKDSGRIAWPYGVHPALSTSPRAAVSSYNGDRSSAATDRLNAIIEAGGLQVHVDRTFPLAEAREAHLALREHYVGKLALRVA
jgi:NADPH:quinone reductase-like Zn-dependent oxidoreductase